MTALPATRQLSEIQAAPEPTSLADALADVHWRYCPRYGRKHDPVCAILRANLPAPAQRHRPEVLRGLPEWAQPTPGLLLTYTLLWLVGLILMLI